MRFDRKQLLLYGVTDRSWLNGQTLYEQVRQALEGGVSFLQLREKNLSEQAFLEEAKEIQKLCREYKVPFIINDNVDLALEIDADGVHVGQDDMEAGEVRKRLGEDKIIGVSAHSVDEKAVKAAGAAGVIRPDKTTCQVIIGTKVQFVYDELKKML